MRFKKNNFLGLSWAIAFCAVSAASAPSSSAFTLIYSASTNKSVVGWQQNTLTFNIDSSCSNHLSLVQSAIESAAEVWNRVPTSSLSISLGNAVTLPQALTHYLSLGGQADIGSPTVVCDSSFGSNFNTQNPSTPAGTASASIPGYAGAFAISTDMKIRGALLVLNVEPGAAANINTLSRTVVDNVLTHEIGHILGLGHSAQKNALMYYATGAGRETVLAKDDMDGITYLYPRDEIGGAGIMGCNTTRFTQAPKSKGETIFLSVEGLALFALAYWATRPDHCV